MEAGFADEAVDTLKAVIDDYQLRGDAEVDRHDLLVWSRRWKMKGDSAAAIKQYSQVAQWNFNYRDVQVRIKRLRRRSHPPDPIVSGQRAFGRLRLSVFKLPVLSPLSRKRIAHAAQRSGSTAVRTGVTISHPPPSALYNPTRFVAICISD